MTYANFNWSTSDLFKKVVLTFLISLVGIVVFSQETRKVKTQNREPAFKDVFYVLKSDPSIKQGEFTRTYEGNFDIKEVGNYENNEKAGVWEYFSKGELQQRIDFPKKEILFNKSKSTIKATHIIEDGVLNVNDKNIGPFLLGGLDKFHQLLISNIKYPMKARSSKAEGKVMVAATITKEGKMIEEQVEEGSNELLHEEALRVAKLIPDDWFPAMIDGKAVDTKILIPISFKLGPFFYIQRP